jgi:hypothetical protein
MPPKRYIQATAVESVKSKKMRPGTPRYDDLGRRGGAWGLKESGKAREQARYRHLRYSGWDQRLSLKEQVEVHDDHAWLLPVKRHRISCCRSVLEREQPRDPGMLKWFLGIIQTLLGAF